MHWDTQGNTGIHWDTLGYTGIDRDRQGYNGIHRDTQGDTGRHCSIAKAQLCEHENQTLKAFITASCLSNKFHCPVARENFSLLATAHDCETGLLTAGSSPRTGRTLLTWEFGSTGSSTAKRMLLMRITNRMKSSK